MRLFRRRQPEPLRYYLYISDTKLDMLFEQISVQARKRISAEVRVDLKLASITLREADDTAPARSAKLRIVERFIDEYHHVGTVAEPGREYFRGSLPVQWGWFSSGVDPITREIRRNVAFFRGRTATDAVVLPGSRRHVLGEQPAEANSSMTAHSATPNILAVIGEHISREPDLGQRVRDLRAYGKAVSEETAAVLDPPEAGLEYAVTMHHNGPTQNLEFLAVPLVEGQVPRKQSGEQIHGILGTPIFVALARSHPATGTSASGSMI